MGRSNHPFRFGNFIGEEPEASDEESEHGIDADNYVYDEDEAEEAPEAAGQELMQLDGMLIASDKWLEWLTDVLR